MRRDADTRGNVWIGLRRELMLMAHAARETWVTVEEIVDADFLTDDGKAAGTIPALYVSGIARAPRGGDPVGLPAPIPPTGALLKDYVRAAETAAGFRDWMAEHVLAGATA